MAYIKWNRQGLGLSADELRDSAGQLADAARELGAIAKKLDPQIASYEGIGRLLRALAENAEEDALCLRRERDSLEAALETYEAAERLALRAVEELPTKIMRRNLVFEDWFDKLLR